MANPAIQPETMDWITRWKAAHAAAESLRDADPYADAPEGFPASAVMEQYLADNSALGTADNTSSQHMQIGVLESFRKAFSAGQAGRRGWLEAGRAFDEYLATATDYLVESTIFAVQQGRNA